MTKTFSFTTKKNNNKTFFLNNKYTNYSEMLDDIINADIIKKNSYLFKSSNFSSTIDNTPIIINNSSYLKDDDFIKAAKFLANYKNYKTTRKLPFIMGKMYELSDGTPIIFYDDEIQIGFDTYKYSNFSNLSFLNGLTTTKKKTIINIFTKGLGDIEINLL